MKLISYFNGAIIPFAVLFIVCFGVYKKTDVFGEFVKGAEDGLKTCVSILPSLIGLICAVKIFRLSGLMEAAGLLWKPLEKITHFPSELVPLALSKTFSSSASAGILTDIFQNYGTDTYIGRLASIMMCCTETIFYTMSVYFSPVGIKDSRYIIKCTIFGMLCGIAASIVLAGAM